jgi:hypothetical protein
MMDEKFTSKELLETGLQLQALGLQFQQWSLDPRAASWSDADEARIKIDEIVRWLDEKLYDYEG